MALAVKSGNEVTITCDGDDEAAACERIQQFMKDNMQSIIGYMLQKWGLL